MRKAPRRIIAVGCMIAVTACLLAVALNLSLGDGGATERDFIEYWAAGQQLCHGANPYDVDAMLSLERSAGLNRNHPLVSWSPPILFVLLLPLGLVDAKTGFILWTLVLLAGLSISLGLIRSLNNRPDSRWHLFGFLFAPALCCLTAGQIGIFLLLGVVLFLHFHGSQPFLAGIVLFPCAFKPHLFLLFALVLLLWILYRKAYLILLGFAAALVASNAVILCFDIHVWTQYAQMMQGTRALQMYAPTLSAVLRHFIDRYAIWPQFIPEVAGAGWSLCYFWTNRSHWKWTDQGLLLFIVSGLCTPYAFFTDETMLLPAILAGLYKVIDLRRSPIPLAVIAGIALFESLKFQLYSMYYLWTVPAWLGWYIYATWKTRVHTEEIGAGAAEI